MEISQIEGQESSRSKIGDGSRILCIIAGSDLKILEECLHEVSRHARIGAVILTTSFIALISMFFAIQTISQSIAIGLIAGLLWGLAIFVLDSYIIASYKKNDNKWKEFKVALPRLFLAIILGCTISIPMELKIFSNEISEELKLIKTEKENNLKDVALAGYQKDISPYVAEKKNLTYDNERMKGELSSVKERVTTLENELRDEIGAKGRTGKEGYGQMAKSIDFQLGTARNTSSQKEIELKPKFEQNNRRIAELDSLIAQVSVKQSTSIELYGMSAQLDALKRLTDKNNYVYFAYWIFFLLILSIETAPIFVKLFTPKGSYDEILASKEYLIFLNQQKKKSDIHNIINQEIESIRTFNNQRKLAQDRANQTLMDEIANAQGEIAKKAIGLWKNEQLKKVDENLNGFIRTANSNSSFTDDYSMLINKWRQIDSTDAIEFDFKRGAFDSSDLLYTKNSEVVFGKWAYNKIAKEIDVDLQFEKRKYFVSKLDYHKLELIEKDSSNVLRLVKV